MLNPYYGLFQYSRDDIYTLQINPDSAVNPVNSTENMNVGLNLGLVFDDKYDNIIYNA